MPENEKLSRADIQSVTRMVNLNLPDDRLEQLMTTLPAYLTNLKRLLAVDPVENEPPAITFDSEARP